VIAAAGTGVAAVDQILVGAETRLRGILIETEGDIDRLAPVLRRAGCLISITPGSASP
jgi:hypothetical protein